MAGNSNNPNIPVIVDATEEDIEQWGAVPFGSNKLASIAVWEDGKCVRYKFGDSLSQEESDAIMMSLLNLTEKNDELDDEQDERDSLDAAEETEEMPKEEEGEVNIKPNEMVSKDDDSEVKVKPSEIQSDPQDKNIEPSDN